jgi:UDP-N-acetylmuramoyl-tripeptide--D-alanyl-D-alanine ligase
MGVVKTIRENLKPFHQIFICEMGATHIGDIKEICDIVEPKIGIITAIGPQHLESFKSIDNIIKTKFELMDSVTKNNGITFLNYNNEYLAKQDLNKNILTYGV